MNNLHKELHKIGKEIVQTLRDGLGKYGLDNSDLANSITYNIRNNELIIDMNMENMLIQEELPVQCLQ